MTLGAMLAFAGNSLLCRLALRDGSIDPGSFTAVRLAAGALILVLIVALRGDSSSVRQHGNRVSALMLFAYAATFSFAYVSLDAATGALLLFGFVQLTMITAALVRGERPSMAEWSGWLLGGGGLLVLLAPGARAPSLPGATLMAAAGVAWGVYSLRGARNTAPLPATTANFALALVLVPLLLPVTATLHLSSRGILLALASGAITSGLGYVLWYAALRSLTSLEAALVQLSVPALAAAGGVLLLAEPVTFRLIASGIMILGGIGLAVTVRTPDRRQSVIWRKDS